MQTGTHERSQPTLTPATSAPSSTTAPSRPATTRASLQPASKTGSASRPSNPQPERSEAEMITPMTSTDPLVEVLAARLRVMDLIGWQGIATWAEESELSFEDLR